MLSNSSFFNYYFHLKKIKRRKKEKRQEFTRKFSGKFFRIGSLFKIC